MKITYVSTYLPQRCGIATYTDYLIRGIEEVGPASEIKVVAERGASPLKQEKFEVCSGSAKFGPLMIFLKRWFANFLLHLERR